VITDGNYLKQWWIIQLLKPVARRARKIWKLVTQTGMTPSKLRQSLWWVDRSLDKATLARNLHVFGLCWVLWKALQSQNCCHIMYLHDGVNSTTIPFPHAPESWLTSNVPELQRIKQFTWWQMYVIFHYKCQWLNVSS